MAAIQKFGIKYPFTSDNNEEIYLDLNENRSDEIKSKVLHILFTPKGQRLRNPNFGTDLIKYIFNPGDEIEFEKIKDDIRQEIKAYLPEIEFEDVTIYEDDKDEHARIAMVKYSIIRGNKKETTTVGVKL